MKIKKIYLLIIMKYKYYNDIFTLYFNITILIVCAVDTTKYCEIKITNGECITKYENYNSHFTRKRYIFYDINPSEGFNLRRDVYIRVATFVKKLTENDASYQWNLVLPPWGNLYHWQSYEIKDQKLIPWGKFFDLHSLRQYVPVLEMYEFFQENFEERKSKIKRNVYELLGVKVDQVLQGHGTTNTGNIARRCFDQPDLFAEALEINTKLVRNIAMILLTFKSKNKIKLKELNEVCQQTYRLHYDEYPWARMNPTMHKLLIHGYQIAEQFPFPIAYFSENANESWHKIYRENGFSHSRQNSRENRILDTFNRAVYLSDPMISLIMIKDRMKNKKESELPVSINQFIETSKEFNESSDSDDSELQLEVDQ